MFYMHFLVIVQRFEHFYEIALYKLKYYYYYYVHIAKMLLVKWGDQLLEPTLLVIIDFGTFQWSLEVIFALISYTLTSWNANRHSKLFAVWGWLYI